MSNARPSSYRANKISQRVRDLGFELPTASKPAGSYDPYVRIGDQLCLAGQISKRDGKPAFVGKVGREWSLDEAQEAARLAALDLLAQIAEAANDELAAVDRIVRMGGFVNATEDFTQISAVIDAASDLLVAVFGKHGRHARAAIGVTTLPRGAAVELDAVVIFRGAGSEGGPEHGSADRESAGFGRSGLQPVAEDSELS